MWFLSEKEKLLDYAEREGKAAMAFDIACTDALERAGNTLLNILLAGAGGALALAVTFYQSSADQWVIAGMGAVSVYLFALSALLVWGCLWARDICPPANEPQNLFNSETKRRRYFDIRRENIESLQRRIDWNTSRNDLTGMWLNRVRFLVALTPGWLLVSFAVF